MKNKNMNFKRHVIQAVFSFMLLLGITAGLYDYNIPEVISVYNLEEASNTVTLPFANINWNTDTAPAELADGNKNHNYNNDNSPYYTSVPAQAVVFGTVPIKNIEVDIFKREKLMLYPGGMTFGVKFYTDGVMLVGMTDIEGMNPAYEAGLKIGDIITKINNTPVKTVNEVTLFFEGSNGNPVDITVLREGSELSFTFSPVLSSEDNKYKAGIWVRDSTAGIGTVTYIDPQNNIFAGLGHGICDIDTGGLMPLLHGTVTPVIINDIIKGQAGAPGELKGYFDTEKIGTLISNTKAGVYGLFTTLPSNIPSKPIPVGLKSELKEGAASIYCTNKENKVCMFSVRISEIKDEIDTYKNFIVEITDPALLEMTGGIVQGMSGSPIIQNGKLVGAVTHVLINNPRKGYGIFIENMLKNTNTLG